MNLLKKIIFMGSFFSFLCSCASTHPGFKGDNQSTSAYKDLQVSAYFRQDLSDKNNFYYEITFENTGNQWLRVDETEIEFPAGSGGPYNVVKGSDLVAWAESLKLKSKTADFTEGVLVAGAILGGLTMAALGSSHGDNGLTTVGGVMAGAGATYALSKDYQVQLTKSQQANQLPENHVLKPFVIPSNGLARKWILWSVPSGKIAEHAVMSMRTVEGDQFAYRLQFWEK